MRISLLLILAFSILLPIGAKPPDAYPDSTNLPLVIIETHGDTIVDDPKITADVKIIYKGMGRYNLQGDSGNIYTGKAGVEIRGGYSQLLPQKSYGFETRDEQGNNLNVPLMDMPAENDWILLANYNDKVFIRNTLAFHLFNKMGHYAPRAHICEVILNNEYKGIYILTEKIKRDKNRLNLARMDAYDNAGDSLTGGYAFGIDYYNDYDSWTSNFVPTDRPGGVVHFVYRYPEPEIITPAQKTYIHLFVNTFENRLYGNQFMDPTDGYKAYLDVKSFIDYFIIGEVSRNVDAYKKSCYYYKDRDNRGGLLHAGPVWDFDWAWKNIYDNCYIWEVTDGSNWAYKVNECNNWPVVPSWITRLLEDPSFCNTLQTRYTTLRKTILSDEYLNQYIDSVQTLVNDAQQRHYMKWPILGERVGAHEVDDPPATFDGAIMQFKHWISLRLAWLDANMPGEMVSGVGENNSVVTIRVFPNPANDILFIESDEPILAIEIYNPAGILVSRLDSKMRYSLPVDLNDLYPGFYLARITLAGKKYIISKFVIQR